ncbi:MAG: aconitate hydratase AcnA [Desulfobacula sp.]|nr:aconitate hydratase AcnA [Desulfobacula sp.]
MTDISLKQKLILGSREFIVHNITLLEKMGLTKIKYLPFAARVLIENLARNMDDRTIQWSDIVTAAKFYETNTQNSELIAFYPARVLMQDFTGVPAVVDFAAMRDAVDKAGLDPKAINPMVPVDLIIDHSIQVDHFKEKNSFFLNAQKEYQRNKERYQLLKWAQKNFDNFRVVPPESGICHQVNLEYLAAVVSTKQTKDGLIAFPDTLVGTDSHTTMINALGVLGWGVGGIEAEAVMLGQPYYMNLPQIIGVNFIGKPQQQITSTDIALYVTQILRQENVVEKIVEYTGSGLKYLTLTDRATISNMAPEYGATAGFFPVDDQTLDYLKKTNRPETAARVEAYCKACGFFNTHDDDIKFSQKIDVDLSLIETSIAGPSRPQDRIGLSSVKEKTTKIFDLGNSKEIQINPDNKSTALTNGSIVIAAITSCTNTSNPYTMIGAGLAAKKAVEKGLSVPWYVKTSLSPGSRVVLDYLADSGLMDYFQQLGFNNTGFGCMTCIGNSGPLDPFIEESIKTHDLNVMSVLSGNRNFEARIHQDVTGNFLMSPILVVIYAIAGRIDIDFTSEPLGISKKGNPVFMDDIWPEADEINHFVTTHVREKFFKDQYAHIFKGDKLWQELEVAESTTFKFDKDSAYIRNPPFFKDFSLNISDLEDIKAARALLVLGDSVTTDHISPAGAIPVDYPAGRYLIKNGIEPLEFNSYGSRRGNHEVMMRGTFANIRIKNQLVSDTGGLTLKFPENEQNYIFDASQKYRDEKTDLIVFGGREYGTGSSRDWAAKGSSLLGIKAVIATSFERIHRSNLVGMGVLPLIFKEGESFETLGLKGDETFEISNLNQIKPNSLLVVNALKNGKTINFEVIVKLNTDIEIDYIKNGGILHYVLRQMIKA